MALNYVSQARLPPRAIELSEAGRYLPNGNIGKAWRLCLGFRQSGHIDLHSTHTVAVYAELPSAKITALLTYPIAEEIVAADVRVTWTYRN